MQESQVDSAALEDAREYNIAAIPILVPNDSHLLDISNKGYDSGQYVTKVGTVEQEKQIEKALLDRHKGAGAQGKQCSLFRKLFGHKN
jgi:hypothetical protein